MVRLLSALSSVVLLLLSPFVSAQEPNSESSLAYTIKDSRIKWGPCPPFLPKGCEIAVLHGDPSKPNVDVFFKVPSGATIPSHTHTSPERMVLVSGQLDLTYEGEATVKLKTGMYVYGPANKPHKAVCAKGAPCVLFIAFEAPLDAIPTEPPGK